jgi:hypothetical protein
MRTSDAGPTELSVYPGELGDKSCPVLNAAKSSLRFEHVKRKYIAALELIVTGELAAMLSALVELDERLRAGQPGPKVGDAALELWNPQISAPELVPIVAKDLGISTDAACLYLQLLAAPDPSDQRVGRWNSWSAETLGTTSDELVATGLATRAARPNSGRGIFLPGAWVKLHKPNHSLERYKTSSLIFAFDLVLAPHAPDRQFASAWERFRGGDRPRQDEQGEQVTTGAFGHPWTTFI